jgi:pimeloyl-ACP methyl ester carboxylesterase
LARRVWKIAKIALLTLLGLVVTLMITGLAWREHRHRQIANATVIDTAKGIDESLFVKIGGIDQWIGIRGQSRDNPVLLLLHGGPGIATSSYPRNVRFSWTKDFTLVQWDQRGAGKTFGRSGRVGPTVTIERMAQDGVEVADFVLHELHKQKLILLGHSWGTILGVHMVKARPDLWYAYVGTGQVVNQGRYRALAYAQLLSEARARHDRQAIQELEAIGPPPYDSISKEAVHTKWSNAYEPGEPSRLAGIATVVFDSNLTFRDFRDWMGGLITSDDYFRAAVESEDLPALGVDFAVPFFVFQGVLDHVTPAEPAKAYFDTIHAPQKQLVLIPNAGHDVMYTRSDEFLGLLDQRVRPLAMQPHAKRGDRLNANANKLFTDSMR